MLKIKIELDLTDLLVIEESLHIAENRFKNNKELKALIPKINKVHKILKPKLIKLMEKKIKKVEVLGTKLDLKKFTQMLENIKAS